MRWSRWWIRGFGSNKNMIRLNPLTLKKIRRFRSIKRGYWSFVALIVLYLISLFGELFVNKRAVLVFYEGELFSPHTASS